MKKEFKMFFVSVCSRLEDRGEGIYIGKNCPLCRGQECFYIDSAGGWECSGCEREGYTNDLAFLVYGQELGSRKLRLFGIEQAPGRSEKVYNWIKKQGGEATRSKIMQGLRLKKEEINAVRDELKDRITIKRGGGQRGIRTEIWHIR